MKRLIVGRSLFLFGIAWLLGCGILQTKNAKSIEVEEKPIVVIVPSHNNHDWIEANLESLITQMYTNYKVIYVDDASTDQTVSMVKKYTQEHYCEDKISLVENKESIGWVGCVHQALTYCPDDAIIIPMLGSDWLSRDTALSEINQAYKNEHVWVTYGQYNKYPTNSFGNATAYSQEVVQHRSFRQAQWTVGKPLTSYAWLYKKVAESDLKKDGAYISAEQAFAYPLLEMAGDRIKYMQSSLYVHNTKKKMSNGAWGNVSQDVIAWLKNKQIYDRMSDFLFNVNQNVMKVLYSLDSGKNKENKGAHTIVKGGVFSLLNMKNKILQKKESLLNESLSRQDDSDTHYGTSNTTISACLSTIVWREKSLACVVPSILHQVDKLFVFLQGYEYIPDFLKHSKIVVVDGRDEPAALALGAAARHFWEEKLRGYILTIDDDIIYPPDYVQTCVKAIEKYNRKAIVGFHGQIITMLHHDLDIKLLHYERNLDKDTPVHILGSGVMAFHKDTMDISINDFSHKNKNDVDLGILAQKNKIPMICIAHKRSWLIALDWSARDLRSIFKSTPTTETKNLIKEYKNWSFFDLVM